MSNKLFNTWMIVRLFACLGFIAFGISFYYKGDSGNGAIFIGLGGLLTTFIIYRIRNWNRHSS